MVVDLARKSLLAKARSRPDLVRKVIQTAQKQGVANTFRKVQSKLETPIPLGYSSAGVIVEVGEAQDAFAAAYPALPVTWLEFERGGEGVCLISRDELTGHLTS